MHHLRTQTLALALLFALLDAGPARAQDQELIEEGRRIFNEETFDGNGRTCATCHPARNNFTIDPEFIASLPADDPLFVAEFNPDLAQLEVPALMRGPRALILENIDGFDQPPVFRGTPHIFDSSFTAPFGLSSQIPNLREFSLGAVRQHFPKTLNRIPGVDFRMPTEHELEALEAYQLSVFSRRDLNYDLDQLLYTPSQQRGRDLFFGAAKCHLCHNGPALGGGGFIGAGPFEGQTQFDIGIANLPVNTEPPPECPECGPLGIREAGGQRAFDISPLFGIAKTAPFFHDNSRENLRRAVDFYDSPFFQTSPGGIAVGGLRMTPQQITDVTAFLAALPTCGNADDFVLDQPCNIRTTRCVLSPGADDGEILGLTTTYPPSRASQGNTTATTFSARRSRGTHFTVGNALLRWNTADCLPPGATVVGARLRVFPVAKQDADDRSLVADWFDWGPTIDLGDYSAVAQDSALSRNGGCGGLCDLTLIPLAVETDFTLDNVENINVNGYTYLRLHIDGDMPISFNSLSIASFESGNSREPQLIIDYIADETPPGGDTATPTATRTATPSPLPSSTPTNTVQAPTATPTVEGSLPDLIATSVSNPPAAAVAGSTISVTDTVLNQGNATAGATSNRYVLAPNPVRVEGVDRILNGGRNVPSLVPGAQSTGTVSVGIQASTPPGTYYLLACANRPIKINETDVNNNCVASETTVVVSSP
jgi:hypothetical protein